MEKQLNKQPLAALFWSPARCLGEEKRAQHGCAPSHHPLPFLQWEGMGVRGHGSQRVQSQGCLQFPRQPCQSSGSLQGASAVVALLPSPASGISFYQCPVCSWWCGPSDSKLAKPSGAQHCRNLCCATVPVGLGVFLMGKGFTEANSSFGTFFSSSMRNSVRCHIRVILDWLECGFIS